MAYLLYDDDCGICTKFSGFLGRILVGRVRIIPMHIPEVEKRGIAAIGKETYWLSFHIVENKSWTSEGEAIVALSSLFPGGRYLKQLTMNPIVHQLLLSILHMMQYKRKIECKMDLP